MPLRYNAFYDPHADSVAWKAHELWMAGETAQDIARARNHGAAGIQGRSARSPQPAPVLRAVGALSGEGRAMSLVEYKMCDGAGCGRVTPDDPSFVSETGWTHVKVWPDGEYDLCPECARKALRAVGLGATMDAAEAREAVTWARGALDRAMRALSVPGPDWKGAARAARDCAEMCHTLEDRRWAEKRKETK